MGLNKVFLLGNVGKDPVMVSNPNGVPIAKFSLATHEMQKSPDGKYVESTEWHEVVVVGSQASFVINNVKKGKHLLVEGSLCNREFTTKDGTKWRISQIKAHRVEFAGPAPRATDMLTASSDSPAEPTSPQNEEAQPATSAVKESPLFSSKPIPQTFSYQAKGGLFESLVEEDLKNPSES